MVEGPSWLSGLRARLKEVEAERAEVADRLEELEGRAQALTEEFAHIRALLTLHGEAPPTATTAGEGGATMPETGRGLSAGDTGTPGKSAHSTGPIWPAAIAEPPTVAWHDALREILDMEGRPLHYRTLHERLRKIGVTFGGQSPAATFLSLLSRDKSFGRVGRGLYWFSDRPMPQNFDQDRPLRRVRRRRRVLGRRPARETTG